jgi:hypothetical protein
VSMKETELQTVGHAVGLITPAYMKTYASSHAPS